MSNELTIPGKLVNLDVPNVLERYVNGESIPELAKALGCNKSSLSRALRSSIDAEQWREAKELHYEGLLDEGLMSIRDAENDCNLARAREAYLRRLEWRASVELPSRWGEKKQLSVSHQPAELGRDAILRTIAELERSLTVSEQQQSRMPDGG